jgi:UDP-N-acetylmuramoylalanine--D-glutamate ligase
MEFCGKRILVLGLGDTGFSMAKWLVKQKANVTVCDSRDTPPRIRDFETEIGHSAKFCGRFKEKDFIETDMIAISPGISLREPLVAAALERGTAIVGDIELFAQSVGKSDNTTVIAITGSNGKSTVTTLTGEMCRQAGAHTVIAGNIGLPILDALDGDVTAETIYVLELSSFQLETTHSLNAAAATVLNISQDHLDRYDSMAGYTQAKARIFQGDGSQILNRDDANSVAMARPGRQTFYFGLDAPRNANEWGTSISQGECWLVNGEHKLMPISALQISGMHNATNVLAAFALCRAIKLPYEPLIQAAQGFRGLPHRVEKVAEVNRVVFYDDSKGTNVGATVAALNGLTQRVVLIAGGEGKGQDFSPLAQAISQKGRAVILIGRDGKNIGAIIAGYGVPILYSDTLEEAVNLGFQQSLPGDAVLLSPACASFDMFRNYQHRAQVYVDAVLRLKESIRMQ